MYHGIQRRFLSIILELPRAIPLALPGRFLTQREHCLYLCIALISLRPML